MLQKYRCSRPAAGQRSQSVWPLDVMSIPPKMSAQTARRCAWIPHRLCVAAAAIVHGRHTVQLVNNSVAFPHGFAFDLPSVSIVNDTVADGVGHGGIVEVLMPARRVKLRSV